MTEFVDCEEGWVNLDFVSKITEGPWKKGEPRRWLFRDGDGKVIGISSKYDPMMSSGTIVPAAEGIYVIAIYVGQKDDDTWCQHIPVVAWRVQPDCPAVPVLVDDTDGADLVLIPAPDGSFIAQYSGVFKSVQAAIDHIREIRAASQARKAEKAGDGE